MADVDFDGTISKKDLKQFLIKLPRIELKEITDPKIDRLFKLLDRYKRGHIQLEDFLQIFSDNSSGVFINSDMSLQRSSNTSPTTPFSGGLFGNATARVSSTLSGPLFQTIPSQRQEFDWKKSAKQQLGLILSKHFADIRTGFDSKYYTSLSP